MTTEKLNIFIDTKPIPHAHLRDRGKYIFHYELDEEKVYDAAIFINTPTKKTKIKVKKGNVFCLMGEPAYKANFLFGYNLYMYKKLSQYDKVFSVIKNADNVRETQPYLGWFEDKYSYFEWKNLKCQNKIKTISCISSDKLTTSGHRLRFSFVKELRKKFPGIDFYGRGYKELKDKHEGLGDYKYSIAIENGSFKNYFSEKIMDCFLNYTVPIYYGCPNIDNFFPENSYILLDIKNLKQSINKIKHIIENDDYESRFEALKQARDLVLEKYNLFSFIEENESKILDNFNKHVKVYEIKPIFSLIQKIKLTFFPKIKKTRNLIRKLI